MLGTVVNLRVPLKNSMSSLFPGSSHCVMEGRLSNDLSCEKYEIIS